MAITGGYRGRFALPGAVGSVRIEDTYSAPEGLYVGINVHYLHGFSYEHFEPDARLDTNAQGFLVVNAAIGPSRDDRPNHVDHRRRLCD